MFPLNCELEPYRVCNSVATAPDSVWGTFRNAPQQRLTAPKHIDIEKPRLPSPAANLFYGLTRSYPSPNT